MRGIAVFLIFILVATPVSALYREAVDAKGTYRVEDPRQYPVIFIPGVAGSELWAGDENAWPGWLYQRATGGYFHTLALDRDGRSEYGITPAKSIRSGLEVDLGGYGTQQLAPDLFVAIYGPFFTYMEEEGYTEDIDDLENGLKLLDFPYDWRKDNYETIKKLDVAVDELLKKTKSDKVILYAHSMGGVVARLYLQDRSNAKKVAAVVFMGSPHQGSPKPFYAFVHGYNFGNAKLSDTTMWQIMGNWEAGYQLLANYPYVQDAVTGDFWTHEQVYGTNWIGQQEYEHYIDDPENWELRYGLPNRHYANKVEKFQRDLGDTLPDYDWIDYYMIEGTDQETTQYFEATLTTYPEVDKPVLSLVEKKTQQGDGTVPARGAKVEGLTQSPSIVYTDHGSIPGYAGTQPLLTVYRESINDEDRRFGYADDLVAYADSELARVRGWPSTGSVWAWVKGLVGSFFRADEEKISAREELRGAVREMLEFARINVVVGTGDEQDSFFLVINDLEIVDGDPGTVRPSTARIVIPQWETFDGILDDTIKIEDAYKKGDVKVKGVGPVKSFQLLLAKWFTNFANRGSAPEPLNFEETLRLRAQEAEAENS